MKKIFTFLSVVALGTFSNAQELLTNPGFESGLAPWAAGTTASYTAPTLETTAPHSGTNNVKYVASATTGFYQNVPVTEGKTYVITLWYKSSGDGTDSRLWSVFKNATNVAVYTTADATTDQFRTNNGYFPDASSWTKYTAEMPAGVGAVSLDVAVRVYSAGTAEFDDFSLMDKATMAVKDFEFDNKVKMNTIVKDFLTLRLPSKSTVNIYSIEGKLISSSRVNDGENISTSSLSKGMYLVTVENNTNKTSRKIIKQ